MTHSSGMPQSLGNTGALDAEELRGRPVCTDQPGVPK